MPTKTQISKMAAGPKRPQNLSRNVKTVVIPLATTKVVTTQRPQANVCRTPLKEHFIATVMNNPSFVVNNGITTLGYYRINPTNQRMFPWLAPEAANYDMYRFKSLSFHYRHDTNATVNGRVALMWDKDSQDVLPANRVEVPEYAKAVVSSVYTDCDMVIKVDDTWRFTNDSNVIDRKMVDYGQFFFAVHSGSNSLEVGDVWVKAMVEFKNPQPTATLLQTALYDGSAGGTVGPRFLESTDVVFSATAATVFIRPAGVFFVTLIMNASTLAGVTVGGNGTLIGVIRSIQAAGTHIVVCIINCSGLLSATPTINVTGATGLTRVVTHVVRCSAANGDVF